MTNKHNRSTNVEPSLEDITSRDILPIDNSEKPENASKSVISQADALVESISRISGALFDVDKK